MVAAQCEACPMRWCDLPRAPAECPRAPVQTSSADSASFWTPARLGSTRRTWLNCCNERTSSCRSGLLKPEALEGQDCAGLILTAGGRWRNILSQAEFRGWWRSSLSAVWTGWFSVWLDQWHPAGFWHPQPGREQPSASASCTPAAGWSWRTAGPASSCWWARPGPSSAASVPSQSAKRQPHQPWGCWKRCTTAMPQSHSPCLIPDWSWAVSESTTWSSRWNLAPAEPPTGKQHQDPSSGF